MTPARPPAGEAGDPFSQLGLGPVTDGASAGSAPVAQHRAARGRTAKPRGRRKLSAVGVIGELLLTMGVVMMLFVGWKYWLNDLVVGNEQNQAGSELGSELAAQAEAGTGTQADAAGIPVMAQPTQTAERFGVLYVPAWGADYARPIAYGIDYYAVLADSVGYYPQSVMPGAVGNFAVAGHRLATGGGFINIHELQIGDPIVVETADGWYTYLFRSGEYVAPSQIDVLDSVPRVPNELGSDRIMTMTSCNPFYSRAERIIAYAVFDSFTPRADGPPSSIAASVGGA